MKKLSDKEFMKLMDDAVDRFKGNSQELRGALGSLVMGRRLGWKPLFLILTKKSIHKYEEILGIEFRDVLPEKGPKAEKSLAWDAMQKVNNFWKAVKGEIPGVKSPELD